ncbi:GntR family transcriptional regulator [Evansella caseinilytica]|uniref:GntR family transcriptional regulator n=1 Tax=Evansella caseinilytica TaxID=1503961 RepID=A0A1H3QFD2_9BACI|nr:GntR family transcriptional regulator [Evansella caseinilytica]SDZ11851.1 GntR family transcriptional regulator [Evansella caseinilytica]
MLDKKSPIPIYYQIEELFRKKIATGELQEGDMIPSERLLSEEYGVSRMTIRQAISNLVNDGLLLREKGRGTFVARKKLEQPLLKLTGFSEDMKLRGMVPETKIIHFSTVELSLAECSYLNVEAGAEGYKISRLRLADNIPMAYEILTLPKIIFHDMTETQFLQQSFYEYVESHLHLNIAGAKQTLEPALADKKEAELLQVKNGSPVLLLKRISRLTDGRPFEYVKSVYRGDRYQFITEMKR